jgi:quinol monooxygenase YgiN
MGRIVIVGYKPKPGQNEVLKALMKTHVPRLRAEGLATEREPILMEAADGTIVEVFEWVSNEAIASAHENPAVLAMWQEYDQVCEYIPVADVEEAQQLFSNFTPLV